MFQGIQSQKDETEEEYLDTIDDFFRIAKKIHSI